MNSLTTDPTLNVFIAHLIQVDLLPKRRHFHWHHLCTENGNGRVEINTNAEQPTVTRWFQAAGLITTRVEYRGEYALTVWFQLARADQE